MSEIVQPVRFCGVCALHDQLASLGRHVQLTHCFSAVAELLVHNFYTIGFCMYWFFTLFSVHYVWIATSAGWLAGYMCIGFTEACCHSSVSGWYGLCMWSKDKIARSKWVSVTNLYCSHTHSLIRTLVLPFTPHLEKSGWSIRMVCMKNYEIIFRLVKVTHRVLYSLFRTWSNLWTDLRAARWIVGGGHSQLILVVISDLFPYNSNIRCTAPEKDSSW